jgi:hypothetical protein
VLQWLPWQDAASGAGGGLMAAVGLAHRRHGALRALATWARELTAMLALYALWQYAGDLSVSQGGGAVARGRDIWRVERAWRLPSEAAVQRLFLDHHTLIRWADFYYAQVHVAALGVALVWLFARHRDRYPPVRNVLVLVTAACLLIQLFPVAPPRLVPGLGLVDTGHVIGPSVYPASVAPGLDQLSAMPSLHVGWAIIVAGSIIYALRTPWRWLAVTYPVLTWLIVVVTGNHYWADGIVAAAICALALAVVALSRRRRPSGHALDLRPPPAADRDDRLVSVGSNQLASNQVGADQAGSDRIEQEPRRER